MDLDPSAILDREITAVEASRIFGVQAATIRKWKSLGHIESVGRDPQGRCLYRLGECAAYDRTVRETAGRAA